MSKNKMINFYEHKDVKKLMLKYKNPHFEETQMNIPARIGVIAPSGTEKTEMIIKSFLTTSQVFIE